MINTQKKDKGIRNNYKLMKMLKTPKHTLDMNVRDVSLSIYNTPHSDTRSALIRDKQTL